MQMSRQPSVARSPAAAHGSLQERLFETRRLSLELAGPLSAEDMTVQPMDDASPTKWHLAHVTWFFETFILAKHLPGYQAFDPAFNYCFNSYYESQGPRQPRPKRGVLTRPSAERVFAYRAHVDEALAKLLARGVGPGSEITRLVEVGINHEQQHQELLLTDILALFAASPLRPAYRTRQQPASQAAPEAVNWIDFAGGIRQVGHDGKGFAWDNEAPRHDTLIHPFPAGGSPGHMRRMARFHGRRRLSHGRAVALRRLGNGQPRGLAGAALLGGARWRVAGHVARRSAAGRAREPRRRT